MIKFLEMAAYFVPENEKVKYDLAMKFYHKPKFEKTVSTPEDDEVELPAKAAMKTVDSA